MKSNNCPYCGGKTKVSPFICQVAELPKPIKLFGKWSLIKMRYREIPVKYTVDCVKYCDGFLESQDFSIGDTAKEAIEKWNDICSKKKFDLYRR